MVGTEEKRNTKGPDNHQRSRVGRHDITDGPTRSVTGLALTSHPLRHPELQCFALYLKGRVPLLTQAT
jgi:hypothetical protein